MILEINNLQLHFQVFGDGPALVVLHGWGDVSDSWLEVARLLSHRFQVFLIDLPGFGGSDAPPQPWGVQEYCQTIAQFVEEMELEAPILLGHSHGGKVACELAAEGQALTALILVASAGVDRPSLAVRSKVYFFKSCKFLLSFCGGWGATQLEALRSRLGSTDYKEAGSLRQTMVRVVNHKLFSCLQKINIPTLILWGSKDRTLSMEQAKRFREGIAHSYIRILWDATHHPHLEQPDYIAELVEEFYEANEQQILS